MSGRSTSKVLKPTNRQVSAAYKQQPWSFPATILDFLYEKPEPIVYQPNACIVPTLNLP